VAVSSWVCHCQACFCLKCLAQLSNLQVWFVGVSVCQCVCWHNVSSELPEAGAEGTCRRQVLRTRCVLYVIVQSVRLSVPFFRCKSVISCSAGETSTNSSSHLKLRYRKHGILRMQHELYFQFCGNASRTFYICFQVISTAVYICLCLLSVSRCEITGACIKITVLLEMSA